MTSGGFSSKRLTRVRDVLSRHLDAGYVPGAVAVVARHGEVHVEATGNLAFEGAGSATPMAADTICRLGSMTKPIVAACAMTLVEDCTLRLDDPVDAFLPELADMTVLADPNGPLEETVPAKRPVTLRDLLTFTLGTGIVVAEPGTIPIADALNTLNGEPGPPPDGGFAGSASFRSSGRPPTRPSTTDYAGSAAAGVREDGSAAPVPWRDTCTSPAQLASELVSCPVTYPAARIPPW